MQLLRVIFSLLLSSFLSIAAFSSDTVLCEKEFLSGPKKKFSVSLTEERWQHIVDGYSTDSEFSGGHDWQAYEAHHVKDDDVVFFDTVENAYIVSSVKGDSLPVIIEKLRSNDIAHFHAIFPHEMLTTDFVLGAFITAHQNGGLDPSKGLFFANHNGFKVAGYYKVGSKRGTYSIMTIFPDLSWRYRIEFKHHHDEEFPHSRFLKREVDGKPQWVRHGASSKELLAQETISALFWPTPIRNYSTQKGDKVSEIKPDNFVLEDQVTTFLHDEWVDGKPLDIIDMFFVDKTKPTEGEFKGLIAVLKFVLGKNFLTGPDHKAPLCRKIGLLKLRMSTAMKNKTTNFTRIDIKNDVLAETIVPLSSECGNLAEELTQQMLNIVSYEKRVEDLSLIPEDIRKVAHAFAHNFTAHVMTKRPLHEAFVLARYCFGVFLITGQRGGSEYVLSLVPIDSLTVENSRKDTVNYTMALVIKGETLFQIRFRTIATLRENASIHGGTLNLRVEQI